LKKYRFPEVCPMSGRFRLAILLLTTSLLAFPPQASVTADNPPVKIGLLADFSGVAKTYTGNVLEAVTMAVADLNAAGGIGGRPVELVVRDAGTEPEKHGPAARELIAKDGVAAIIGGASTPAVLAVSAVCLELKVPYLVGIGNSQTIVIEHGHPYVFQFQATSTMETKGFSIFATLMPWRRYAWVGPDYSWGREILTDFKKQFASIGRSLQWTTEAWHPLGTTEYDAIISKILAGRPDALLIASWGQDAEKLLAQAKRRELFDKIAVFGWFTYDMTGELGRIVPNGMWGVARGGPFNYLAQKYPLAKKLNDDLITRTGAYPNGFSICCFDAFLAWQTAARLAGSTDPQAVAARLKGLRYTGLRGESYIRPADGQVDCPTYFGRLVYQPQFPFAVWDSVVEIPAAKTWLREDEVWRARGPRPF
jgi:branched-chain amino acid transport system substrate-binding protein